MSRIIETLMLPGPAGRLEALLEEPAIGEPVHAVLVCHPHPQHGGTMHNKVVYRLARGLRRTGAVVLRFNFRGVNLSEGTYGNGDGELEDARAALDFLRARYPHLPFSLAGFSFGSRIILRLGCQPDVDAKRLIAVGYPTRWPDLEALHTCTREKIFIQSTRDEFGPMDQLTGLVSELPEPKSLFLVEARDHFFGGSLAEFENLVEEFVWDDHLPHSGT
ncbi:MAG: alpha/beta hydrolase [Bryobacterales bacterium]|nr:alpha/beta hydrolase [Bryobacterales bacterium]